MARQPQTGHVQGLVSVCKPLTCALNCVLFGRRHCLVELRHRFCTARSPMQCMHRGVAAARRLSTAHRSVQAISRIGLTCPTRRVQHISGSISKTALSRAFHAGKHAPRATFPRESFSSAVMGPTKLIEVDVMVEGESASFDRCIRAE